MTRTLTPVLALFGFVLLAGCGHHHATEGDGGNAVTYTKLEECNPDMWLGLPDSISCPKSGGLCQRMPWVDNIATNVCLVGKSAYAYSVIAGQAFSSEMRATLNSGVTLKGSVTGQVPLVFTNLADKNTIKIEVEYKTQLQDSVPIVYTKTYGFPGP